MADHPERNFNDDASDERPDPESDPYTGDAGRPWRRKDEEPEPKKGSILRESLIIIGCVLLLSGLIQTFVGRQYIIPSESMQPTLQGCPGCSNDRIVIDKLAYRFGDPEAGDVVVFRGPTDSWNQGWMSPRSSNPIMHTIQDGLAWFGFAPPDENNLVKRVIATGGQTVQCQNDSGVGVTVDGQPLNEPYIDPELQSVYAGSRQETCYGPDYGPIQVPEGNVWVMGDNRGNSADSRAHVSDELQGTIPVSDIRGKVRFIIYPFSRIGGVGAVDPQQ